MPFAKLSAPTLKELFIKELENMIISEQLPIGSKLPSERELADSMQVSRAVVNAGLTELAHKGFLEVRPRVGTFVTDYRKHGTSDVLISLMNYNGGRLGKAEIKSLLEMRLVMENLAIELLMDRVTDDDIDYLTGLSEDLSSTKDPKTAAEISFNFHHYICVISGNIIMPLVFNSFRIPTLSLWERYFRLHGMEPLSGSTKELLTYIAARDKEGAIRSLTESINATIYGDRKIFSE